MTLLLVYGPHRCHVSTSCRPAFTKRAYRCDSSTSSTAPYSRVRRRASLPPWSGVHRFMWRRQASWGGRWAADGAALVRPDGPLSETVPAQRPITVRDLLTFTWGFGMQGAMFMSPEPWPILTATIERELSTFGPPLPARTPDPDTWMARLGELPLLAQPGERWLYQSGSQVLGVLASRAAGALAKVLRRSRPRRSASGVGEDCSRCRSGGGSRRIRPRCSRT